MKKVRYAIGVLGVAPALGLMLPAANAGAAVTHDQGNTGKILSLHPVAKAVSSPLHTCQTGSFHSNSSDRHGTRFVVAVRNFGHCVGFQSALLYKAQTGLTERFRCYNSKNNMIGSFKQPGTIITSVGGGKYTYFKSSPNINGCYTTWTALVKNGTSDVQYGPLEIKE